MCTEAEGKLMERTMLKYYRGRKIEDEDREMLEKLGRAAYIEYYLHKGSVYARASETGRSLRPKFIPYMRLLLGRV